MLQQTIGQCASSPIQIHAPGTHIESDLIPDIPSSADPDAPLVAALKTRTAAAFDDLVKQFGRRILNVAMRITKNREDAKDVVQEAFLKVFKNIDGFRADSKFATWLTRIVINQALMLIRGNPQKFVSIDEGTEVEDRFARRESATSGATPEQLYAQREFEGIVLNLTNVRKSSRRVMELHLKHELSEVEISQVLSLTLSAVKARLHRGRLDLREAMSRRFPSTKLLQACKKLSPAAAGRSNQPMELLSKDHLDHYNGNQEQRPNFNSASGLAGDNLLPERCSESSLQAQSCLPHHFDPQLLARPSHSSVGRPENCF